jgi:murein DD-endopeptidase MepM/ murein hydrolase activator NlpD
MRFTFPYPVKPWLQTQAHGIYNPAYHRFGFDRHNGNDVALGRDRLIRAPFPGKIVRVATKENGLWQPAGGGVYIGLLSKLAYEFDDGVVSNVLADFLHCEQLLRGEREDVLLGTVLAVADNTGFSTGPHTHIQLRRCSVNPDGTWTFIDQNDANGSFDPTPYFTGTYAKDIAYPSWFQRLITALLGKL